MLTGWVRVGNQVLNLNLVTDIWFEESGDAVLYYNFMDEVTGDQFHQSLDGAAGEALRSFLESDAHTGIVDL